MNKDLNCTLSEKKNGDSYDVPSSNYESLCNPNTESSSRNNVTDTSSTTSNDVQSNIIQPSTALQGKLVARVLPHSYGEYNTRQSVRGRVNDARELIQCLQNSNKSNCGVGSTVTEFNWTKGVEELQKIESIQHCSENVLALDIYLIRMDRELKQRHPNSNDPTHVNHVITNHSNENVLRLRMNRSSNESASRTLRRLEVSTRNKLKGMLPTYSKRSTNRTFPSGETMCQLIRIGEYDKHYVPIDISEWSSEDMWNHCAEQGNENYKIALTLPSSIISGRNSSSQQSSTLECVELDIISNPPTLLSVETFENFTSHIFVGVPIVLRTRIIYAIHATITWFANNEVVCKDCHVYTPTLEDVGKRLSVLITPVRLDHSGEGCQEAYSFSRLVEVLPTMPIVELRQNWIHRKCESSTGTTANRLRVLTYNILADLYAGREIDQKFMYSHCDAEYLARGRRMPMIVAEILAYNADIICLQEVDASVHDSLLYPVLTSCGYQGFYSNKVTAQPEGCSMFWSTATFDLASQADMLEYPLRELLTHESSTRNAKKTQSTQYYDAKSSLSELDLERWESMHGINSLLESHDEVRKVYKESVGQIVQIAKLTLKSSLIDQTVPKQNDIVVANTHLFYHPMADHIRLLQAYAICHKLDKVRRSKNSTNPILFCGDFNSSPLSGALRLLTTRSLSPNESDCWKHLNVYKWECGDSEYMFDHGYIGNTPNDMMNGDPLFLEEEFVDAQSSDDTSCSSSSTDKNNVIVCPPTISLPKCFPRLISGCKTLPAFTNYAVDFVETLDYIFASSTPSSLENEFIGFESLGEAPMPTEEMVMKYVAMPNEAMPSDHVAIVCDFGISRNAS